MGVMAHTHIAAPSRFCSVCRKTLTDPVSVDAGIGPHCRDLANEVLAKQLPANVPFARAELAELNTAEIEVPPHAETALAGVLTAVTADLHSADWRPEVRLIARVLSFNVTARLRVVLYEVVKHLGYAGFAAILEGVASHSKAFVSFAAGRLICRGPRNADARDAIKKIAGWRFVPAADDQKAGWSLPAAQVDLFNAWVQRYYPLNEGLSEAIVAAIGQNVVDPQPLAVEPPVKRHEEITTILRSDGWVAIFAPYNAGFLDELKSRTHFTQRQWVPTKNNVRGHWIVRANNAGLIKDLLLKYYGHDVDAAA